jgi:phosphatidate phosphatase APP1
MNFFDLLWLYQGISIISDIDDTIKVTGVTK